MRVADMVRDMMPTARTQINPQDEALGIHLRGNEALYTALTNIIKSRIEGRAQLPEPSDPLVCKSMMARDRELQLLLRRLEFIYLSPSQTGDTGEQPAA